MKAKILFYAFFFVATLNTCHEPQQEAPIFLYKNAAQSAVVFNLVRSKQPAAFFSHACFTVPQKLEYARSNNLPAILFVPSMLTGSSPLDDNALMLEGARVALTWASIFHRFEGVDVRVIEVDNKLSTQSMLHSIETILAHQFGVQKNKEESIQNRFVSLSILLQQPYTEQNSSLEQQLILGQQEPCALLSPLLPQQNVGQKRFLITGAAGFIGSHLTRALIREGHQVIGLDNFSCCDHENIKELQSNQNFCFFEGDVTSPLEVEGPLDYIVHLASIPSPEFYYRMPIATMRTGLHGTRNMLELAVKKGALFLFSSTSEVYGDPRITPQDEGYAGNVSPIGKRSQYDQSKRGAETLIKMYFETHGIDVRIARIFNTYGPHMQLGDGRVVTNFIRSLLHHKPMTLYGNGMQTRSFSYIDDTVQGLLKLIHVQLPPLTPIKERVVNIGNNHELTVVALAQCVNSIAPLVGLQPTSLHFIESTDSTDPKQRNPNLQRARNVLGYEPNVQLEEGLQKTISYFLKKEQE